MLYREDVAAVTALPKSRLEGWRIQANRAELKSVAGDRDDSFGQLSRDRISPGIDKSGGAWSSVWHGLSPGARGVPSYGELRGTSVRPYRIVCQ